MPAAAVHPLACALLRLLWSLRCAAVVWHVRGSRRAASRTPCWQLRLMHPCRFPPCTPAAEPDHQCQRADDCGGDPRRADPSLAPLDLERPVVRGVSIHLPPNLPHVHVRVEQLGCSVGGGCTSRTVFAGMGRYALHAPDSAGLACPHVMVACVVHAQLTRRSPGDIQPAHPGWPVPHPPPLATPLACPPLQRRHTGGAGDGHPDEPAHPAQLHSFLLDLLPMRLGAGAGGLGWGAGRWSGCMGPRCACCAHPPSLQ